MKLRIRLNRIAIFFFAIIASVITLSGFFNYTNQSRIISENFANKNINSTQQIREFYRLKFDKLQHEFVSREQDNLDKMTIFYDIYKKDKAHINLSLLERNLNKETSFGNYQVFLINRSYIIEKASYPKDIGYNFGEHKVITDVFDLIFDNKVNIDISPVQIDSASMSFKRYILKRSDDGRYLLQIAFVLDFDELFNDMAPLIQGAQSLKLYLANDNLIQPIQFDRNNLRKQTLSDGWMQTKSFLTEMIVALNLPKKHSVNKLINLDIANERMLINQEIDRLFQDDNVLHYLDAQKGLLSIYSATNSLFNKKSETKLILKAQIPSVEYEQNIKVAFYYSVIPVVASLVILSIIYLLLMRSILTPLLRIVSDLSNNRRSNLNESMISEITMLSDNYNRLHDRLNSEVERNHELLKYNRSCIADTIHQIKTPLTNIMMNGEMIKSATEGESLTCYIDRIDSSINMISNSCDDLAYAITLDTIEYTPFEIDLTETIRQRIFFFTTISHLSFKNIEFALMDEAIVFMNQIELERLLDNNLSNAIKYADAHKPIVVSLVNNEQVALLQFESFGKQILNKERIFDEGYREEHGKRGLGLGLSMVRAICLKYGIIYSVSSEDGKNTFTYQFKLNREYGGGA